MRVGIIGGGTLATSLAYRFDRSGHEVVRALPRGQEATGTPVEQPAGAATVEQAVRGSEVAFLALPLNRALQLPPNPFIGRIVTDATEFYRSGPAAEPDVTPPSPTSGEVLDQHLPGAAVVQLFHTLDLLTSGEPGPLGGAVPRTAIPLTSDEPSARAVVAGLISDLGFDAVDAGGLAAGRLLQARATLRGPQLGDEDVRVRIGDA
jgi:predicted dinucleotide-binding enzyme